MLGDRILKVSVIVTVFNEKRNHLEECLKSLLSQTLRPDEYEVILVDDCSTNQETIQFNETFDQLGSGVRVIRHSENLGLNKARHTGVRATAGDYVVFVDADDYLSTDALESLRMVALRTDADVVLSHFSRFNEINWSYDNLTMHGDALPDDYLDRLRILLSAKSSWTMCGRLMRRSLLDDAVFDMPRVFHEDMISLTRIMFNACSVASVKRHLYFYRWNPSSITSKVTNRHIDGICLAFSDWVAQARSRGLLEELLPAIIEGQSVFLNHIVRRAAYSVEGNSAAVLTLLENFLKKVQELPVRLADSDSGGGMRFLNELKDQGWLVSPTQFRMLSRQYGFEKRPKHFDSQAELPEGLSPSVIACRLKDKIVIICQVDYHFRNAAAFAKQLALRGYPCVVIDNSTFAAGGKRPVSIDDRRLLWRTAYLKIEKPPYGSDWLSTARLVITFNDFNDDFREALEYRTLLGQRSVCMIEGISDFLRVDFHEPRYLPYRRCDTVFLAGQDDAEYFEDRKTYVIGLPVIEALARKQPRFPPRPVAVLNVNFTYGALEERRDAFVAAAGMAFEKVGWEWVITQHPMDKGELKVVSVSKQTQYELIDSCTVFVSRFATGILEALASGKPAIYFNPHGEKVAKFKEPMGAYDIATTEEELVQALRNVDSDLANGVDFLARALPFLAHHTGYSPAGPTAGERFADAIADLVETSAVPNQRVARLFFERLEAKASFRRDEPGLVFGDLDRRHYAQLEEADLVARYFGQSGQVMIDVGANIGQSADTFLGKGWTVHAFEPDPKNRRRLEELSRYHTKLHINAQAVSDTSGNKVAFYASDESTGISSLSAFTAGHKPVGEVETVTLADYCRRHQILHADFLKVDVEGHDKFVLDGVDWAADNPDVVLAEFEDAKTLQNGYSAHELAGSLVARNYSVYVSEWLPIERYGLAHDWCRLIRYSPGLDLSDSWGNFIAFRKDPGEEQLRELVLQSIKFAPKTADRSLSNLQTSTSKRMFRFRSGLCLMQTAPKQWHYVHGRTQRGPWIVELDLSVAAKNEFVSSLRIQADRDITINVSLMRHGNSKYEGISLRVELVAGLEQTVTLSKQFNHHHAALQLQIDVVELSGGGGANLVIDDLLISEYSAKVRRQFGSLNPSICEANRLFRDRNFALAIQMYLFLYERRPLQMYADNALLAARKLGLGRFSTIEALKSGSPV